MPFFSRDEAFDQVKYFVNHETYKGPELPEDQWQKPSYEHYRFGGVHWRSDQNGTRRFSSWPMMASGGRTNATITSPWSRRTHGLRHAQ